METDFVPDHAIAEWTFGQRMQTSGAAAEERDLLELAVGREGNPRTVGRDGW